MSPSRRAGRTPSTQACGTSSSEARATPNCSTRRSDGPPSVLRLRIPGRGRGRPSRMLRGLWAADTRRAARNTLSVRHRSARDGVRSPDAADADARDDPAPRRAGRAFPARIALVRRSREMRAGRTGMPGGPCPLGGPPPRRGAPRRRTRPPPRGTACCRGGDAGTRSSAPTRRPPRPGSPARPAGASTSPRRGPRRRAGTASPGRPPRHPERPPPWPRRSGCVPRPPFAEPRPGDAQFVARHRACAAPSPGARSGRQVGPAPGHRDRSRIARRTASFTSADAASEAMPAIGIGRTRPEATPARAVPWNGRRIDPTRWIRCRGQDVDRALAAASSAS